tara:strand:- start:5907 stop:6107 length:201 start_codon:yes stop_codon:yes gene_type:complete
MLSLFVLYSWRKILFGVFIDHGELVKYQESNLPLKPIVKQLISFSLSALGRSSASKIELRGIAGKS